jgi:hypothetical protein
MKFETVQNTRDSFKLCMIQGSYGHPVPESFYLVNQSITDTLVGPMATVEKHWYIYLLTLGLEHSNRWLLGKPIISQSHLECFRMAMATVPLHAVNTEVMLNFFVKPEVVRAVLGTLVRFYDNPGADLLAIGGSNGIMDARYFQGLPLQLRLKLHSVWSDPFGHLATSVNKCYS